MSFLDSVKQRLSSLLSMWLLIMLVAICSVVIQDGHINRDGLLYLKQAYLIGEGSWKEGLALYPWPFFSILIAIVHKITGLHLQVVAHAVDLALFGIAAWFYLKTLNFIYKQKHIVFYGGIILLSFIPIMDDYVGMVLRDHGLWAGCMMGTYFYFVYLKDNTFKNNLLWQLSFAFAGLFRPEAFAFLLLIPFFNIYCSYNKIKIWKNKAIVTVNFLKENTIFVFYALFNILNKFFISSAEITSSSSGRLDEFAPRVVSLFNQFFSSLPISSSDEYLTDLLLNYPIVITFGMLFSILIYKWISSLGLIHGGLLLLAVVRYKEIQKNSFLPYLIFFLIISFVLVGVNLFNVFVLSNRYWVFHWWWILILIAPGLCYVFEQTKIKFIFKILLTNTLIFMIFVSLHDRSEDVEMDVAKYLIMNSMHNINFKNNERIRYYFDRDIRRLVAKQHLKKSEYTITNYPKNGKIKSGTIIKNFPENKPKFSLIHNDR